MSGKRVGCGVDYDRSFCNQSSKDVLSVAVALDCQDDHQALNRTQFRVDCIPERVEGTLLA